MSAKVPRLPEVNSARMADWANLQTDIVGTIIRKLAMPDYIRFRAVCTSWNRVCACRDVSNNPRVDPWLMLPTKMLEDAKFFSIPERKNETIRILSTATICGSTWTPVGSSNGWLVFFNPTLGTMQLVNPISSAQFQLPPVGCKPFSKAVLLDMSESNFSVAVIYGDQKGYKVTSKGSKGWSSVDSKHVLIDVFKHRSQLYTIDIYGTVELWAEPPRAWPDEDGLLVDPNLHHNFAPDEEGPIWDQYVYDNWMEDQLDEDGPDADGLLLGPNLHHNFAPDEDNLMGAPYLNDNFEPDEYGPIWDQHVHHNFAPDEDDPMGIPNLYDDLELAVLNDGLDLLLDPNQLNCLVETPAGDLMKVKRQSESKFAVWILNKGTSSFERTNDIGESGLFVSRYSSFCLPAKDHPNMKANCVYFIDSYKNLCAFNLEHGTKELVEGLEILGAQNQQDMYLQGRPRVESFLWFVPSMK